MDYAPNTMDVVIQKLQEVLKASDPTRPIRLCIPSLGSPAWGDISPSNLLYFLSRLRSLLKQHPKACASLSLAPHTSSDKWGGGGWVQKVAWCSDAAITMSAFGADTHLTSLFPSQHGFVQIHRVPAPNTLLPASDKLSILRGLSSAAGASAGSGENNLAFKCTRKRLVFETMHLDLEGGVSERRTTPSNNTVTPEVGIGQISEGPVIGQRAENLANVDIEFEQQVRAEAEQRGKMLDVEPRPPNAPTKVKTKKKVAFQSERPDVYDF